LRWQVNDDAQLYASWSKGFRSGGYNLRITRPNQSPGPVDEEEQTAIELGFKGDWLDGRLRTNVALFRSELEDLQRTTTAGDAGVAGVIQQSRNTADATIQGVEFEISSYLTDELLFSAFGGYLDGEYDTVLFDISGDDLMIVDEEDLALDLPLLAQLTYGVSLDYTLELSSGGSLAMQTSYNYRSEVESTDDNDEGTTQDDRTILNASIKYTSADESWSASLYGKNLTDEVILNTLARFGTITSPTADGPGTIQPLAKGRVIGVEVTRNF